MKIIRIIAYSGDPEAVREAVDNALEDGNHNHMNGVRVEIQTLGSQPGGTVRLDKKLEEQFPGSFREIHPTSKAY
jgi:hypothetical protein